MNRTWIRVSAVTWIISSLGMGCTSGKNLETKITVENLLKDRISLSGASTEYVAAFKTKGEAKLHADQALASGARVQFLDSEGRTQKVIAPTSSLSELSISTETLVNPNNSVQVRRNGQQTESLSEPSSEQKIQSLLAARKVVGVDALQARIPEADGRAVKVVVFDTGIDFGVEGIEKDRAGNQKLEGYFDLTLFGQVTPTAVANEKPVESYQIGEDQIRFEAVGEAQKVQSFGILDERLLANVYFAAEGVDFNNDHDLADRYAYLVGINSQGLPTVWIDRNQDGVLSQKEALTDYNTTYSYLNFREDVAPSGARPVAVTIRSALDIQFHTVPGGHGTSCAIIIAGDGYLDGRMVGMAPKAQLLSYVLDISGQDVYTMDQFLQMFLHAREQGVDAISISWGFSTADLASARFVADFLDREIASQGIAIGIAAGNEGPGISSGSADDYIPHHAFGVGALLSQDQARNVYGWTGTDQDSVIWYSSFGPTRGGRAMPDVVSPLATLVRDNRGTEGPQFYPFSGTSSATPALIGAVSSLMSALKHTGEEAIDIRLLKLAVQNSAKKVEGVEAIRQGGGALDVNAAYDLYLKLASELKGAKADPEKRKHFAFDLRASARVPGNPLPVEGIRLHRFQETADVVVKMTEESAALMDALVTVAPLIVSHEEDFFETAAVLPLQTNGARLTLRFNRNKLSVPGIYTDRIQFARPDGLVLLTVPVVVQIAGEAVQNSVIQEVSAKVSPFGLSRYSVKLSAPSPIILDAVVRQITEGRSAYLGVMVRDAVGVEVGYAMRPVTKSLEKIVYQSDTLPAGHYEVILFRHFANPSVVNEIEVHGVLRLPYVESVGVEVEGQSVSVGIRPRENMNVAKAELLLEGVSQTIELVRGVTESVSAPVFLGEIDLGVEQNLVQLGLRQDELGRAAEHLLHMSVAFINEEGDSLYRGWINVQEKGSPLSAIELSKPARKIKVIAYPNIVNWEALKTTRVKLEVGVSLGKPVKILANLEATRAIPAGGLLVLNFDLPEGTTLSSGISASLRVQEAGQETGELIPIFLKE